MSTFFCTYCGKHKSISERTDEHVLPRRLGGGVNSSNPFLLRTVCRSCNSTCGLFVDAPFTKNTLVHSSLSLKLRKYLSIETGIFPLSLMGRWEEQGFIPPGLDCDLWLGPTGDSVYHFHKPHPEIQGTLGMITPAVVKGVDPGFVITFFRSNNPAWHPAIVRSVLDAFPKETIFYFPNVTFSGTRPSNVLLPSEEISELIRKLIVFLQSEAGKSARVKFALDIGFADRFQAKTALGFGALFLTDEYTSSNYAQDLRDFMWTKTAEERESFLLHGSAYFSEDTRRMTTLAGVDYGITVILMPSGPGIGLYVNFYKEKDYFMAISNDRSYWPASLDPNGIALAISPGIKKCAGPLPLIEFIASNSDRAVNSAFNKLRSESERAVQAHPPFDV